MTAVDEKTEEQTEEQSFAEVLSTQHVLFPPELLGGEGWKRLLARAGELPASASTCFYPEFRLDDPAPAVDFFIFITPKFPEAQYFIRRGEQAAPDSPAARFGAFLADISRPDSTLARWSNAAWVAYDLIGTAWKPGAEPGIYIRVRRPGDGASKDAAKDATKEASEDAAPAAAASAADDADYDPQQEARGKTGPMLADLVGWPRDDREARVVERAFEALPPDAFVIWAGALPGRKRSIRIVTKGIGPARTPDFLERLGWPGSMPQALEALAGLEGFFDDTSLLSFNVSADGPATNLGFELHGSEARHWLKTSPQDCEPLIERLVEQGWCLPAKGRALLGWLGRERVFSASGVSLVWKGLNHAKVTIRDGVIGSKAYVGMAIGPLDEDTVKAPEA